MRMTGRRLRSFLLGRGGLECGRCRNTLFPVTYSFTAASSCPGTFLVKPCRVSGIAVEDSPVRIPNRQRLLRWYSRFGEDEDTKSMVQRIRARRNGPRRSFRNRLDIGY